MSRRLLWLSLVVACSESVVPPAKPAPIVAAPAPVPAATPAEPTTKTPEMVVADSAGFAFRDPDRRKKVVAALPAIDKLIGAEMKKQGLPGLAFGIVLDGELVYAMGFGVTEPGGTTAPDPDTIYRIGSITKSFTGLALLALRDDGALQLDDPLAKWVPEASKLVYPTKDSQPITLRQLAHHTSGLPRMGTFDFESSPAEKIVADSLATLALEAAPGTRWHYSNLGFGLLGIVVGHAAKSSYHDVVTAKILKPLGMTVTVWDQGAVLADKLAPAFMPGPKGPIPNPTPARLGVVDGAGGIYSSVRDMAKYVAFQMAAYPPRSEADGGAIRRATVREAHSTGVPAGFKAQPPASAQSYGYGWAQFQTCEMDDLVTHNGAIESYRAEIQFSPSRGIGIVALTNFGNGNPSAIAEAAMTELVKTGALEPREPQGSPMLTEAMKRLLVIYHQWDEAAFAKILARPVDAREKDELATYKQLHGACTSFELVEAMSSNAGRFAITCERGKFTMDVNTDAKGQIEGFFGFSRGIEPPPAWLPQARAMVALHNKWDDKVFQKQFAKSPVAAVSNKELVTRFQERHGPCKITSTIHLGFDWGFELQCKKEDVEMFLMTAPTDAAKLVGIQLRPRTGAKKKCD